MAALAFVLAYPGQSAAKGKHGGGDKVSVHKHGDSGGGKDGGSHGDEAGGSGGDKHGGPGDDDHGGSDARDHHGGSDARDHHGGSNQANEDRRADAGDHQRLDAQAKPGHTKAGAPHHDTSAVEHRARGGSHGAGALRRRASATGEDAKLAKAETRAARDAAPDDPVGTAKRATRGVTAADPEPRPQPALRRVASAAGPVGRRATAASGTSADRVLSRAASAAQPLTSTVTGAVKRIGARLEAASRPLTRILDGGVALAGQLVAEPGAMTEAGPAGGGLHLAANPRPSPAAGSAPERPSASAQSTVPEAPSARVGAIEVAGAGVAVYNGHPADRSDDVGPARPGIAPGASAAVSPALPVAAHPPPRAPPVSPPPSTDGLALMLLFSVFAALLATGSAASTSRREALLLAARRRRLLPVSALERPG